MRTRRLWPAWFAGLSATQVGVLMIIAVLACLGTGFGAYGSTTVAEAGDKVPGDVDCDDDVDSVDGLKVLRHVASLENQQAPECPAIGSEVAARVTGQGAVQGTGSMSAMSVDMALFGNSATSVLSIQPCAQLNANGRQDAEETGVDTLTFDITAQGIPATHPIIGFGYVLSYDSGTLQVTAHDVNYLLGVEAGSEVFDGSDPVPDATGDFDGGALDSGPESAHESGSGILARATVTANKGATTGLYPLSLGFNGHISYTTEGDEPTAVYTPLVTNSGFVSINEPCPLAAVNGDVDCDGDVDSVDALRILREVAALPNELPVGCPPIS